MTASETAAVPGPRPASGRHRPCRGVVAGGSCPMTKPVLLPFLALLIGCGHDSATGVNPRSIVVPNVAGTYRGGWTLQFVRQHDGYSGTLQCNSEVKLSQYAEGVLQGTVETYSTNYRWI